MDELPQSIYSPLEKHPAMPAGYLLNFLPPRLRDDAQKCPRDVVEAIQRKQDELHTEIVKLIQDRVDVLFEFAQRTVFEHRLEQDRAQRERAREQELIEAATGGALEGGSAAPRSMSDTTSDKRPRKSSLARSGSKTGLPKHVEFDLNPEVNVYESSAVDTGSEDENESDDAKDRPLLPGPASWDPSTGTEARSTDGSATGPGDEPAIEIGAVDTADVDAGDELSDSDEQANTPAGIESGLALDSQPETDPETEPETETETETETRAPRTDSTARPVDDDDRLFAFDESLANTDDEHRSAGAAATVLDAAAAVPATPVTVDTHSTDTDTEADAAGVPDENPVSTYASSLPIEINFGPHTASEQQELDEEELEDEELVRALSKDPGRMSFSQRMIWERASQKS